MDVKDAIVMDILGREVPAQMVVCPNCQSVQFFLFAIETVAGLNVVQHNHIQCTACGEAYCQGGCDIPSSLGWPR